MEEDSDLARAIALSLGKVDPLASQQQGDHALAMSLQEELTTRSDKPTQVESDHLLAMALTQAEESEEEEEEVPQRRSHKELVEEADRIWAMRLQASENQQAIEVSDSCSETDVEEEIKKIVEKHDHELAIAIKHQEENDAAPKNCPFEELSLFAVANFDTPSKWVHGPRTEVKGAVLQAHVVSITSEKEVEMYFNHLLATNIGASKSSALPNA